MLIVGIYPNPDGCIMGYLGFNISYSEIYQSFCLYGAIWPLHIVCIILLDKITKAKIRTRALNVWPGKTIDKVEKASQGQDWNEEPGEDDAHHSQAKQHQGQVLQEHLSMQGETHIHCGDGK